MGRAMCVPACTRASAAGQVIGSTGCKPLTSGALAEPVALETGGAQENDAGSRGILALLKNWVNVSTSVNLSLLARSPL